ncbi:ER associated protein disulfide isomerase Pdi2 [Schizosaccharomyces japonicus yFS275]|uniref:ER associated protein disulfide isomerase Pdi2 n=1 Tax=Schizosaccharomyces japonicus (strain yFS275 / FY16936) TaxID=402676 RepID=B6K237_SCHJY|nr:ER associated protein disulfide isomerase Pdi2 [Schizosaccharomyces japonicus yFS275]EEB07218.1 ER associated protein disulfide isomerase Pdi2 [Schizosaccharomyces japonicus yFS275]
MLSMQRLSVVLCFFLFVSLISPSAADLLTAVNFDEKTATGLWFVEFFQPNCIACQNLSPKWKSLVASREEAGAAVNFYFGQVDCQSNKELCSAHSIMKTPTLRLFKNGKKVEDYDISRGLNVNNLAAYVDPLIAAAEQDEPLSTSVTDTAGDSVATSSIVLPSATDSAVSVPSASLTPSASASASGTDAFTNSLSSTQLVSGSVETASASASVSASVAATSLDGDSLFTIQTAAPDEGELNGTPLGSENLVNVEGLSKRLIKSEDIENAVKSPNGWFIQFYSSECLTCEDITDAWKQMARRMRNRLNVGHVDCDTAREFCSKLNIHKFPSLYFFREGESVEYLGLRNSGDISTFADDAANLEVREVDSFDVHEYEKSDDVYFLFFYNEKTTEFLPAIRKTAIHLLGHAKLFITTSASLASKYRVYNWPKLIAVRDGKPNYFPSKQRNMADYKLMLDWMKTVWLPLLPELRSSNSHEITDGNVVVLFNLDPELPDFEKTKKIAKEIATKWTEEEARNFQTEKQEQEDKKNAEVEKAEVQKDEKAVQAASSIPVTMKTSHIKFAWVNGNYWNQWLKNLGVDVKQDGPRVILYDLENKRYWDTTIKGKHIPVNETEVFETLEAVQSGSSLLKPKVYSSQPSNKYLDSIGLPSNVVKYAVIMLVIAIVVVIVCKRRADADYQKLHNSSILPIANRNAGATTGKFD